VAKISLPGRLIALLEGESLVIDATGLVFFAIAVGVAVTGQFDIMRPLVRLSGCLSAAQA